MDEIQLTEDNISEIIKICNNTLYKLDDNELYKFYIIEPSFPLLDDVKINFKIIRKKLNNLSKIPLYVSVGLSNDSFCNNLSIINKNIDKIKNIYSEIILFILDKETYQSFVKKSKEIKPNIDDLNLIGDIMQSIIADHYDKIIRKINKENKYEEIDYLGVSFSGGIGIYLSQITDIKIRNLILQSPGTYEGFKNIPTEQNIILCWCIQDDKISYKEEGKRLIEELKIFLNKLIILTDLFDLEINERITHRLQDELFDTLHYLYK